MKNTIYIFLIIIFLTSCRKEPQFYHSRFYPVIESELDSKIWENNDFFDNIPISVRLESRIDFEDYESIREGIFEPIVSETTTLQLDKDIYYLEDTIKKGENLLNYELATIETYEVTRNSSKVPDSYIFWINKLNDSDFHNNNVGFYTIYISTATENNYQINDSTVIKIQ